MKRNRTKNTFHFSQFYLYVNYCRYHSNTSFFYPIDFQLTTPVPAPAVFSSAQHAAQIPPSTVFSIALSRAPSPSPAGGASTSTFTSTFTSSCSH